MSHAQKKKKPAATPIAKAAETLAFLGRFATEGTKVGALFPSSRELAEAMLEGIAFEAGDIIVEYGPGTGAFTELILERLPEGARYLGIERDPHFHGHLVERFPGVDFHKGSAEEIRELLDNRGWSNPRLILSGLPFASMPHDIQELILTATRDVLHDEGEFRTFTYPICWYLSGSMRFRKVALNHFGEHRKSKTINKNIPPAKVLSYRKPTKIPQTKVLRILDETATSVPL
jgi:phosphatidylethanolamine/phosphatidyl-N-methylethanolamine N-methyltransferase